MQTLYNLSVNFRCSIVLKAHHEIHHRPHHGSYVACPDCCKHFMLCLSMCILFAVRCSSHTGGGLRLGLWGLGCCLGACNRAPLSLWPPNLTPLSPPFRRLSCFPDSQPALPAFPT